MCKKILLLTHHLVNYAGSELVILDLAKEFKLRSFKVTVGTFDYDYPVKELFEQEDIIVKNVLGETLDEKEFFLIWAQHAPILYRILLEQHVTGEYIISSSLSPFHYLEAPPLFANELSICLANSEETKRSLISCGVKSEKIIVFLNSVNDEFFSFYQRKKTPHLKKIIVVSNHVPKEIHEVAKKLKIKGIMTDIFGLSNRFEMIDPNLLKNYDAIITIGRTVQFGLAIGIPVYCYDYFGGPGWITSKNIDETEFYNFSGRCCNRVLNADNIIKEIEEYFINTFEKRFLLHKIAWNRYSITKNLSKVLHVLPETNMTVSNHIPSYSILEKHSKYMSEIEKRLFNPTDSICQVYWDSLEGYAENNSSLIYLRRDNNFHIYELKIPKGEQKTIRLDPINYVAFMEIDYIEIYQKDLDSKIDAVVWSCCSKNKYADLSVGRGVIILSTEEKFKFFTLDNDPHLLLNLMPGLRRQENWIIRIAIRIGCKLSSDSITEFQQKLVQYHTKEDLQYQEILALKQEISNNLTEHKQTISEMEKVLETQHNRLITLNGELTKTKERLTKTTERLTKYEKLKLWKFLKLVYNLKKVILKKLKWEYKENRE